MRFEWEENCVDLQGVTHGLRERGNAEESGGQALVRRCSGVC